QGSSISDIFGPGEPLYLTPLIEKNQLDKARALSRVGTLGLVRDVPSYSGFLTVNPSLGSNIFFWFFPAMDRTRYTGHLYWVNLGTCRIIPFCVGISSHREYKLSISSQKRSLKRKDTAIEHEKIGYKNSGALRNPRPLYKNLLYFCFIFYKQLGFFFCFPPQNTRNEGWFALRHSCKYVPTIGHAIDTAVQPRVKINLKGIAIGNADIDPLTMMGYADYIYEIGLVDRNQAAVLRERTDAAINLIKQGRYLEANDVVAPIFDGSPSIYNNLTGFTNYFNYLLTKEPEDQRYYISFIQTTRVRKAIHVGSLPFYDFNPTVYDNFNGDKMVSAKPWFTSLLEKYKVLLYSGQLDIILAYPYTESFLASVNWTGASALAAVSRQIWRTPGGTDIYGYVRQVANFTEVLVRNGGHILPYDQPEAAYDMITRFIDGKPFV
ncbi:serine carboxypeptidase, putative, partial [Ixodes scapularis]